MIKHKFTNERQFDEAHAIVCPDSTGLWVVISDAGAPERARCPYCGAEYTPEQTYFDADANPAFDDDGHKLGSGEYHTIEFEGVLPLTV